MIGIEQALGKLGPATTECALEIVAVLEKYRDRRICDPAYKMAQIINDARVRARLGFLAEYPEDPDYIEPEIIDPLYNSTEPQETGPESSASEPLL